jgi:hypothetical protein
LLRRAEYEGKAAAKRALFGVTVKEDISQGMTHVQADVAGEDIAGERGCTSSSLTLCIYVLESV